MDVPVGQNGAGDLALMFFDWGYKTPRPLRAGTQRRAERENARREFLKALYASTPNHPPSRQVRRYIARQPA